MRVWIGATCLVLLSALLGTASDSVFGPVAAQSSAPAWHQVVTSDAPGHLNGASERAVGYDPVSNRLLFFGGQDRVGGGTDGVWTLVGADGTDGPAQWFKLVTIDAPPPVKEHAAAYDQASNRLIVYGGCLLLCTPFDHTIHILRNANGLGGPAVWEHYDPGGDLPQGRNGHTAVYDPASNRLIVFGGDNCCGGRFADTWVLHNANGLSGPLAWELLRPPTWPTVRSAHAAVYDVANNRMMVFGGSPRGAYHNDTWVLANANGLGGAPIWTQLALAGAPPPSRIRPGAVYDAPRKRMIVYGGFTGVDALSDVWVLANANGLGDAPYWTELRPAGAGPASRSGPYVAYRDATQRFIVYGGTRSSGALSDGWILSELAQDLPPPASPRISPVSPAPLAPHGALQPGDILVADGSTLGGTGGIIRVDARTGAQSVVASGGNFAAPHLVAVGPGSELVVVDRGAFGAAGLIRVNPSTGVQSPLSAGGGLFAPTGMALTLDRNLIVVDERAFGGAVLRVNPRTGAQSIIAFGPPLYGPTGLALTTMGDIYIADAHPFLSSGVVLRVDATSGAIVTVAEGEHLRSPNALALADGGDLFVADRNAFSGPCAIGCGGIIRVNPASGAQTPVATGGYLAGPRGIALDADGYVVTTTENSGDGRVGIVRIDPHTGTQELLTSGGFLVNPTAVAIVP